MKLHLRLTGAMLGGILTVTLSAQIIRHYQNSRRLRDFSTANLETLEQREWKAAANLCQASQQIVRDSLERGEMQKLDGLLKVYGRIDGVLEYSLFDNQGRVAFSSHPAFMKKSLPTNLRQRLLNSQQSISNRTAEAFEVYQPLVASKKCTECHDNMRQGSIAGVTLFRATTKDLGQAQGQWGNAIAHIQAAEIRSGVLSTLVLIVLCILLAYWQIRRMVALPLNLVAERLSSGSGQTASTADQVSAASQSLAEGASEQAAALEETSASLEQMASMVKRNAENAQNAEALAEQTRAAAETGAHDMREMGQAMNAIKASSDNIAKILKTIDEIAFQTNILALNAAVEAARAGEAGMGFAVVADEVRNLAQRCAQAARETATKIEDSIQKSEQGVQITGKVAQSLEQIVAKAQQVDNLVAEIATASQEQSQGISQVNTAVTEMDKVTQSNAANAEQTASAAAELNAQARTLKEEVAELLLLVGGTTRETAVEPGSADILRESSQAGTLTATPARQPRRHAHGSMSSPKRSVSRPVARTTIGDRTRITPGPKEQAI